MNHETNTRKPGLGSALSYVVAFLLLLLLTAATVGVAFLELGVFALPAALAIASLKIVVVALVFMHLRFAPLCALVAAGSVFWVLVLVGLTLSDYLTRDWLSP
jgi:cytochrome c oxidase subunit 4